MNILLCDFNQFLKIKLKYLVKIPGRKWLSSGNKLLLINLREPGAVNQYPNYSDLRLSIGFAMAALTAWNATVKKAMAIAIIPADANTNQLKSTL